MDFISCLGIQFILDRNPHIRPLENSLHVQQLKKNGWLFKVVGGISQNLDYMYVYHIESW